jgi:EmrB/QacA subfamily drug resistance transporter
MKDRQAYKEETMKDVRLETRGKSAIPEGRIPARYDPTWSAPSWVVLLLLSTAQFMVVLDFSIVNVALPSIQRALQLSTQNLQWIVSAYALTVGGLLLLSGRAGDLFGRRRLFILGLTIFVVASLLGGFAPSTLLLILARVLQGVGAALVAPNAFSLLTTTFEEGAARNKALGVFGAVVSSGAAIGNVLGGALTAGPGWRWVFFVNVPVAALALLGALLLLQENTQRAGSRRIDVPGALVGTMGLFAFVFVMTQGHDLGWGSLPTLGLLALALACMIAFVLIEARVHTPLVRLSIFRSRTLTSANLVSLLAPGTFGTMIFMLTLYMQEVLGYTAFTTGLVFLPLALLIALTSSLAPQVLPRLGPKGILLGGMSLMTVGLFLLLRITPEQNYVGTILPGMLIVCLGIGPSFTTMGILATQGVRQEEQGLAAGLLSTTQQVGQGLMLAVMTAVATAQTAALHAQGAPMPVAQVYGFHAAFVVGAGATILAFLLVLTVLKQRERWSISERQRAMSGLDQEKNRRASVLAEEKVHEVSTML